MAVKKAVPILYNPRTVLYSDSRSDEIPVVRHAKSTTDSTSGPWGVFFNLTNSVVGAGVIGIPHAIADGGFLIVIFLLVVCGLLTMYSMNTIISLGVANNVHSFEQLAKVAFGNRGFMLVCFFQFTFSFGANIAYLLVVADTIPVVLGNVIFTTNGFV